MLIKFQLNRNRAHHNTFPVPCSESNQKIVGTALIIKFPGLDFRWSRNVQISPFIIEKSRRAWKEHPQVSTGIRSPILHSIPLLQIPLYLLDVLFAVIMTLRKVFSKKKCLLIIIVARFAHRFFLQNKPALFYQLLSQIEVRVFLILFANGNNTALIIIVTFIMI